MKDLNYELARLTKRCHEGARATQADRHRLLQKSASDLQALGFKLKAAKNLKRKHVTALVSHWQSQGLADSTLKNRMSALRWLADTLGKTGMVPASNQELGVTLKGRSRSDRAKIALPQQLVRITDPYTGMAVRLQQAFGLRVEEALKLIPAQADQGNVLHLNASWCKGGRGRGVPIVTEHQRALLDLAKRLARDGSLIPAEMTYKQQRNRYYYQTRKVGLTNPHGLRHGYAQSRYEEMTGFVPASLGGLRWHQMTPYQKQKDRDARQVISNELGHNRISVTNVYLGGAT
jgi:integrase